MFGSLFASKNKKLVEKWKKEHQEIVKLANELIGAYYKNDMQKAKSIVKKLNELAINHIIDEDIEFYAILKDEKRKPDAMTAKAIKEFVESFKGTKDTLMEFLRGYSKDDAVLDENFIETFKKLVDAVAKRIDYEEHNVYSLVEKS